MQQNGAPNNETVSAKVDSVPNFYIFLVFSNYDLDFFFSKYTNIETQIYLLYLI